LHESILGDRGAATLSKALPSLSLLQELELSGTRLGHSGTAALSEALPSLTQLQTLSLFTTETRQLLGLQSKQRPVVPRSGPDARLTARKCHRLQPLEPGFPPSDSVILQPVHPGTSVCSNYFIALVTSSVSHTGSLGFH